MDSPTTTTSTTEEEVTTTTSTTTEDNSEEVTTTTSTTTEDNSEETRDKALDSAASASPQAERHGEQVPDPDARASVLGDGGVGADERLDNARQDALENAQRDEDNTVQ